MLPSRKILKDELDKRFEIIQNENIHNLKKLRDCLKNKEKINDFSKKTNLSIDYLTILKREISSYISNPVKLSDFPDVDIESINKLDKIGIYNSKQLFEKTQTNYDIEDIIEESGISEEDLVELINMSDLVRIWGVGAIFARIVLEAGIKSVKEFAGSDPKKSYKKYIEINNKKGYTKATFVEKDIEFCVEMAKELEWND
jgi:hypothetical protein